MSQRRSLFKCFSLPKWVACSEFVHIKLPLRFEKEERESSPLSLKKSKACPFPGCIFRELVHLVHSCQNRVRKGQQINVRESASLHKSPTSPREKTPSWPRQAFQSGDMSQQASEQCGNQKTSFAQIQTLKSSFSHTSLTLYMHHCCFAIKQYYPSN